MQMGAKEHGTARMHTHVTDEQRRARRNIAHARILHMRPRRCRATEPGGARLRKGWKSAYMGGLRRPLRSKVLPSGKVCLHSGSCAFTPAAAPSSAIAANRASMPRTQLALKFTNGLTVHWSTALFASLEYMEKAKTRMIQ